MKTSVPGYPRIGGRRELKKAAESYLDGSSGSDRLEAAAREIRLDAWMAQARAGIDFIPSNDFSLYDNALDAAILFDLVPDEYREAGLSPLDAMFAMARGMEIPGGTGLKALPMRKWFNTNYHCIVPRLDRGTRPRLSGSKPVKEFREALEAGILTRPAIVGPLTLLRLCQFGEGAAAEDFFAGLADAYGSLMDALVTAGAQWIQFDEPFLATDLSAADIELFQALYGRLSLGSRELRSYLHIPYGSPFDCFGEILGLGFASVGLDFVEGKESLGLLRRFGYPEGMSLVAGVVNGKNVWKCDFNRVRSLLGDIAAAVGRPVGDDSLCVGPSCSLLHVPISLEPEKALEAGIRDRLAFAEEKLVEIVKIARAAESGIFIGGARGCDVEDEGSARTDTAVLSRISSLREQDFHRSPARAERAEIQRRTLKLPALPTTTIGSFPQTEEVRDLRVKLRKGQLDDAAYSSAIKGKIAECVAYQESIGLDVLVHGEFERNDMVEFFGQRLSGFAFTSAGWVQSYGTRCVKPPIVVSDVSRPAPMTVELAAYAQSLSTKPVKGMLTGPVTILNWSFPREDISLGECACQIALAVRDEVLDLERAGIGIIQIDEAALREKMPLRKSERDAYFGWAIRAFRLAHSGLDPKTQVHTHMCYSEFSDIVAEIDSMDADVITFEAARSELGILDALAAARFETAVGPGVYDIHSPRVPSEGEIEAAIRLALAKLGKEAGAYDGLWINPDCGLKTRKPSECEPALANMVLAALRVRNDHSR
jgi:5-methyltetrahydropteroyltriglutamate--homocysteine methyltransferase